MTASTKKPCRQKAVEAEKDFRNNLGAVCVAVETSRMAMVFTNASSPEMPIIFANDSFLALTGYSRPEVLGKGLKLFLGEAVDDTTLAAVATAFSGSAKKTNCEMPCRNKDGSFFWVRLFASPVCNDDGELVQYLVAFDDLSDLKSQLTESRALIGELSHRVKNTLAVVQSVVRQALRSTADTKHAQEAIESRLGALARSHELLTRGGWEGAGLRETIREAVLPFTGAEPSHFELIGKDLHFPSDIVSTLTVVFNELATNALKYGAWSKAEGKVCIEWGTSMGPKGTRLNLKWTETGGPLVTPPMHRGFGLNAIERGLSYEIGADVKLEYKPEGIICTIDFPMPDDGPVG